jgi:hypothetical protein
VTSGAGAKLSTSAAERSVIASTAGPGARLGAVARAAARFGAAGRFGARVAFGAAMGNVAGVVFGEDATRRGDRFDALGRDALGFDGLGCDALAGTFTLAAVF